jgi:hypothetical protein
MSNLTVTKCYKCSGTGHINAFNHVVNGECFACKGKGTVMVDVEARKAELSHETVVKCEFILKATEETFEGLSYVRLLAARNFAHTYVMASGARELYGETVLDAWRQHGEPHFQAAQEKKLSEFYGN